MMMHPSFRRLAQFAAGELAPGRHPRLARHLERCPACRRTVAELRAVPGAVAELTSVAPPAGAWGAIAARVAAGEQVILPAAHAAPPPRRLPRAVVRVAAAVAVLLAAAAGPVLFSREAAAEISELRISPERPGPGATVRVEYRPGTLLAGADRLVLRARMLDHEDSSPWGAPVRPVAQLRREGGVYTGSFTLPDSVVYAVLAVEDAAAERVDANAEQWDVVVHDADGRPLPKALVQRSRDLFPRDMQAATEAARQAAELYPDRVGGWYFLLFGIMQTAPRARQDSLLREHRARLSTLSATLQARSGVAPQEMVELIRYAESLQDTATVRVWRDRLYAAAPGHRLSHQMRIDEARERHGGDAEAASTALEAMWGRVGEAAPDLAFIAFMGAVQRNDVQGVGRWGDRLLSVDSAAVPLVARYTPDVADLRPRAMERARRALGWMRTRAAQHRPLTHTAAEHARDTDRSRGYFLGRLGRALLQSGQTRAGIDTLDLALQVSWDPALFREVADTRLAQGDTAGAVGVLARLAADPGTTPAAADSARARLGRRVSDGEWVRRVQAARLEMSDYVMRRAVSRPLRGEVVLATLDGGTWTMQPESAAPTLVAVWSRWCVPSRGQLHELEQLARALRERGVRVVTVTRDTPDAEFRRFIAENGLTFPIYLDTDNAAQRALQNQGTPTYLMLDARGRIRFDTHGLDDVLRQAEVLRAER